VEAVPPAASAPIAALPPPVSAGPPPPSVLATDRPASALDGLFVPKLYGITFTSVGRAAALLGLVFSGNDRMMLHRWTVSGYYQFSSQLPSVSVGYSNRQLAPFTLELSASQFSFHDLPPALPGLPEPTAFTLYRRDRTASFDVSRAFYGNPIQLGASFLERYRPGDLAVGPYELQRFGGLLAAASYAGTESTAYSGTHRALRASARATLYPAAWTTAPSDFVDLRGTAGVTLPLPLSRRHDLSINLRGRALAGLSDDFHLLEVGGVSGDNLFERSSRDETPTYAPGPPIRFAESLRGFEDHPLAVNRIFIADATYFYPFIIDWGTASSLGLLPSFFLSQINLRLFGTGATTGSSDSRHLVVGGSLSADFSLWVLGLSLRYQLARRVTDDQALVHLITLGS
jgi:hypothetical protein